MLKELVTVIGKDKHGLSTMSVHCVVVSEAQHKMNSHIDMAIFEAEELGYVAPFITFANNQHQQIINAARHLIEMKSTGYIKE